jgi:hypothetical protein
MIMYILLLYTLTVTSMKLLDHSAKPVNRNHCSLLGQQSHNCSPETQAFALTSGLPTWPHVKKGFAPIQSLSSRCWCLSHCQLTSSLKHGQLLPPNSCAMFLKHREACTESVLVFCHGINRGQTRALLCRCLTKKCFSFTSGLTLWNESKLQTGVPYFYSSSQLCKSVTVRSLLLLVMLRKL